MTAIIVILVILGLAVGGQLYLNNLADFRKKSKHLAGHDQLSDDSNQRLI